MYKDLNQHRITHHASRIAIDIPENFSYKLGSLFVKLVSLILKGRGNRPDDTLATGFGINLPKRQVLIPAFKTCEI